jgi:hypothetical protein
LSGVRVSWTAVPDHALELLATEVSRAKLARRDIGRQKAEQRPRKRHVVTANLRGAPSRPQRGRRLVIGLTDNGRALTLVIEATVEPTTWLPSASGGRPVGVAE